MSNPIYHLASTDDADKLNQSGSYRAPSMDTEGFIHCCTGEQLSGVVQRYYADAKELVILHLDTTKLTAKLVFENTMGGDEQFPHIYGEINAEAVTRQVHIDQQRISQIAANKDAEFSNPVQK